MWRTVLVLGVMALGTTVSSAACGSDSDGDRLSTATELADTWAEGWTESDPELATSVFTDGGRNLSFNGSTYAGQENADHVRRMGNSVDDVVRIGDLAETSDGSFTWVVEAELAGALHRGTLEAELEGDLISYLFWAEDPVPSE